MNCTVIVGAQWDDEGKGKVVSFLSKSSDVVARFQGEPNAGHTVYKNGKKYFFRIVPSGILHAKKCLIGNGMVVNIQMFLNEIALLEKKV